MRRLGDGAKGARQLRLRIVRRLGGVKLATLDDPATDMPEQERFAALWLQGTGGTGARNALGNAVARRVYRIA